MKTVTISVNETKNTLKEVDVKKFADIMIKENFIDNNMEAFYQFEDTVEREVGTTNITSIDDEIIKECLIEVLIDTLEDDECYGTYIDIYFSACNNGYSITWNNESDDDLTEEVEKYLKSADLSETINLLKNYDWD